MFATSFVQTLTFAIAAMICVTGALGVVALRNPVHNALSLVATLFGVAVLFIAQEAYFLAAIQVIVYAGAIVVLFLFVIMLLNIEATPREWKRWPAWLIAGGLVAVMGVELSSLRAYSPERLARELSTMPDSMAVPAYVFPSAAQAIPDPRGVVGRIAEPLFQGYLIPFEITSVLLLAAVIGAVVLAKKRL